MKKQAVHSVNFNTNDGWVELDDVNAQGLFLTSFLQEQKCFNAKKFVEEKHAALPYMRFVFAMEDFNDYVENN